MNEQFHTQRTFNNTKHERWTVVPREVQETGHSLNEQDMIPGRENTSFQPAMRPPCAIYQYMEFSFPGRKADGT